MASKRQTKKEKALTRIVGHLMNRVLVARYDALKRQPTRPVVEIRTELSETENQFTPDKRILAYEIANNLYDNSTAISSTIDTSIRLTIGKRGGTPLFTGVDKDTMQNWFDEWKNHAGYAEGESFQEMLALILRIVKLHGDLIVWIDPILTEGRIRIFDADQIVDVNVPDFEKFKAERGLPESCRMVGGVVVDGTNKVWGYFVSPLRNRYSVSIDDAMFLPANTCRRVAYHKKHTQFRGEPSILANAELTEDTKSLLKSEVASARLNSEIPIVVTQPEGMDNDSISSLIEGYSDIDELAEGTGINTEELGMLGNEHDNKTFAAYEGKAAIASVAHGTTVTNLDNSNRPSPQIQSFVDLLNDSNGRALGVMSCLSRGRADNSYSSGQIEIEISYKAFEEDQQLLERYVIDYVIHTLFPNAKYDVYWDSAIQIDPEKYQKTCDIALKGGRTTYRQILGADWKATLIQLAEEKAFIKSIGLDNLSFFQTNSGNESTEVAEEHKNDDDDKEGENI